MKNSETLERLGAKTNIDLLARASEADDACMGTYRDGRGLGAWLDSPSGRGGRNVLYGAFVWSDSPEGTDFWICVLDKINMPEDCSDKLAEECIEAAADAFMMKKLEGV